MGWNNVRRDRREEKPEYTIRWWVSRDKGGTKRKSWPLRRLLHSPQSTIHTSPPRALRLAAGLRARIPPQCRRKINLEFLRVRHFGSSGNIPTQSPESSQRSNIPRINRTHLPHESYHLRLSWPHSGMQIPNSSCSRNTTAAYSLTASSRRVFITYRRRNATLLRKVGIAVNLAE
jgi:hypothetical protein